MTISAKLPCPMQLPVAVISSTCASAICYEVCSQCFVADESHLSFASNVDVQSHRQLLQSDVRVSFDGRHSRRISGERYVDDMPRTKPIHRSQRASSSQRISCRQPQTEQWLHDGGRYDAKTRLLPVDRNVRLFGFRQSWKYFRNSSAVVRNYFRFAPSIASSTNSELKQSPTRLFQVP